MKLYISASNVKLDNIFHEVCALDGPC